MTTQLIRGFANYPASLKSTGCVMTIGNFDGVHLGHQALLALVKHSAKNLQLPTVVTTFEPQPAEFFSQGRTVIPRLTRFREKFNALAACDIDYVLVLPFNKPLADMTADDFVQQVLYQGMNARHVIVGDDFHFGLARRGDVALLKKWGQLYGYDTTHMPSFLINGERVSSTLIREAIQQADHVRVANLLGRPYSMEGRVVHGDKLGRRLGFPTANIFLHRPLTAVKGVYTVRMYGVPGFANTGLAGVANVGTRPTVNGTRSLLEVYLLNFQQEIYGCQVRVEFCEKLRDEERYASLDILKTKIAEDVKQAEEYFKRENQ